MELVARAEQRLEGFRPMLAPECLDLRTGAVALCATNRALSLRHAATEQLPLTVEPHAHLFEWQQDQSAEEGGSGALLRHIGFVSALGYVCSARPQRRFVVLSQRRRFVVVADGRPATVFALNGEGGRVEGGLGPRLPHQICELQPELGKATATRRDHDATLAHRPSFYCSLICRFGVIAYQDKLGTAAAARCLCLCSNRPSVVLSVFYRQQVSWSASPFWNLSTAAAATPATPLQLLGARLLLARSPAVVACRRSAAERLW
jgi:hypothetical protein